MHAKAITTGDECTHLTTRAQFIDTSLVGSKTAGLTLSRTTSLCLTIRFCDIMNAPQSPIGFAATEDDTIGSTGPYALFQSPTCHLLGSDTNTLKCDLKAGKFCCRKCNGLIHMW